MKENKIEWIDLKISNELQNFMNRTGNMKEKIISGNYLIIPEKYFNDKTK